MLNGFIREDIYKPYKLLKKITKKNKYFMFID